MESVLRDDINSLLPSLRIEGAGRFSSKKLPLSYRSMFDFSLVRIEGEKFLAVFSKESKFGSKDITRHQQYLEQKTKHPIVWIFKGLNSGLLNRLVANNINFVVPDRQIHLPYLFKSVRKTITEPKFHEKKLTPSAARILIRQIVKQDLSNLNQKQISVKIGESPVITGRALGLLVENGLAKKSKDKVSKVIQFESNDTLIHYAKSQLNSPVDSEFYVKKRQKLPIAGESLLSKETMLASNEIPTFAISKRDVKNFIDEICSEDEAVAKIEVWRWSPEIEEGNGKVDPVGLYFSLRDHSNERVQICLEEYLEKNDLKGLLWSED